MDRDRGLERDPRLQGARWRRAEKEKKLISCKRCLFERSQYPHPPCSRTGSFWARSACGGTSERTWAGPVHDVMIRRPTLRQPFANKAYLPEVPRYLGGVLPILVSGTLPDSNEQLIYPRDAFTRVNHTVIMRMMNTIFNNVDVGFEL